MNRKKYTDILAILCTLIAIITGIMLHNEVHHLFVYNDLSLWNLHQGAGIILIIAVVFHCLQHKFWFKNYKKLPLNRKRVTTIFLIISILVAISGIILMCGSHSHLISIFHYALGIIFTLFAIGHIAKRWKIFKSILKI